MNEPLFTIKRGMGRMNKGIHNKNLAGNAHTIIRGM